MLKFRYVQINFIELGILQSVASRQRYNAVTVFNEA